MADLKDQVTVKELIQDAVNRRLDEMGVSPTEAAQISTSNRDEVEMERQVRSMFDNDGFEHPRDRFRFRDSNDAEKARVKYMEFADALATTNFAHLIPRVISNIVREAVEPQLSLTKLLRPVRFSAGTQIVFPAWSAMNGVKDMGETDEYPELQSIRLGGTMTVTTGKVGCSVRVTEDVVKYSQWDILGMLVRGAGRALARHKEQKVANLISDNAILSFSNTTPNSSTNGSTTGRDVNAAFNNTLRLDDLFVVYADLVNDGFIPNTLLMNAMGWLIFARDPSLRAFGFANGGPLFRTVQGDNGTSPTWEPHLYERSNATQLSYSSTHFVDVPNLFPVPLAIVVSPVINFNTTTNVTDMFMCDREEMGLLVIDEDPMTDQFDDPRRDIRIIKFRERYGLQLLNQGYAVRKLEGISTDRGFDFEDSKLTWDAATDLLPS
jgi:hypothetical protein